MLSPTCGKSKFKFAATCADRRLCQAVMVSVGIKAWPQESHLCPSGGEDQRQVTPCLPFLRKRSPDGATPTSRKGWKAWPGWLTYSGRFTHMVTRQLQRRTGKVRWPKTDWLFRRPTGNRCVDFGMIIALGPKIQFKFTWWYDTWCIAYVLTFVHVHFIRCFSSLTCLYMSILTSHNYA